MEEPLLVRQHDVPLQWHEAVALLRCVTDALEDGRIRSIPAPGELALESDGSVYLAPRMVTTTTDGTQLAQNLRDLLREFLPADAPAELRALAEAREGSTAVATLGDFRQALAFFERPSHEKDRRALAARLSQIGEERQLESEIERLSRKARIEPHTPAATGRPAPPPPRPTSFRKALVVSAVLVVAAGAAVAIGFASRSGSPAGTAGQSGAGEKGIIDKLRDAAQSAFGTPAPPPQTSVVSAEKFSPPIQRRKPAGRRNGATSTTPSQPPPQHSFDTSGARLPELAMLPTLLPSWSPPELRLPQVSTLIHDRGNFDVIPPVLLRPHLPAVGVGVPGAQLGAVEVVVAEDGRVEQVRLVRTSAERRYYDAMILAAVKAWVFRPARRSGQPIRYRLQIPLT